MKGKLIKTDDGYILEGNNLPNPRRLSLKNCESIERGYDLDELVKSKYPNVDNEDYEYDSEAEMLRDDYMSSGFLKGAKAILEILGDKKFSEQQIRKAIEPACGIEQEVAEKLREEIRNIMSSYNINLEN